MDRILHAQRLWSVVDHSRCGIIMTIYTMGPYYGNLHVWWELVDASAAVLKDDVIAVQRQIPVGVDRDDHVPNVRL